MSAWIVSPRHIDYVVECIRKLGITEVQDPGRTDEHMIDIGSMSNTDLGRMLMWENVRSVSERYPYDTFESLPGPIDKKRVVPYRYRKSGLPFNTLAALKAKGCYEYQSCEHSYWPMSISFGIMGAITREARKALPFRLRREVPDSRGEGRPNPFYLQSQEYSAMPWGIDEDTTFDAMDPVDPKVDEIVEAEAKIRRIV